MKELAIISGKGGTGKTSLTAAFAWLADEPVLADCDVDAADLHLVLQGQVLSRSEFWSGKEAVIRQEDCSRCGSCLENCRYGAVRPATPMAGEGGFCIDPLSCEGCGVCVRFCPVQAIDFRERYCGEWMISETRGGPMVHARLGIAAENSGKLVSTVRREARRLAEEQNRSLVIIDGPPGVGCPVIASVTGTSLVLVVTEPTVSGEHDLLRVLDLARHFSIPAAIVVNKWDLNPDLTQSMEEAALRAGARVAGRLSYCNAVTRAQLEGVSIVEFMEGAWAREFQDLWKNVHAFLENG